MMDAEEIQQYEHHFCQGDRVVLTEHGYKRMSLRDVYMKTITYRVVAVVDKNIFKIRLITK